MRNIKDLKYLLDENVDRRLRHIFNRFNIKCDTLNDHGLNGMKNGELSDWVRKNNFVLVTHDSDFELYWKSYKIPVLLIRIHPSTLKTITPLLESFLYSFDKELAESFLLKLNMDNIMYIE